jgi:4-amino-4-deoxy-L-arabinose transferase-like glycosyltransferase
LNATSLPGFWRPALLLVALVMLAAVPQAALLPLLDRDEPRFAEASREMLESRNFVVPTFNYAPRYAKPPLIYWAQAASFLVFGENAFAARLPSLLAVAGTALLLLVWGRALGSHEGGLIAALAYAFCLQVMQQGRVATADALLIFWMTLTAFAGWRMLDLVRTGRGSWNLWGVILALGFAGGFLAKGPEALLPIVPILISARWLGWRGVASFLLILALGLLLVSAWAIPAYVQTHGDYWREGLGHDVGDRMVTGFQGHGASTVGAYLLTLPLYFLTFWLSALPWSPLSALNARRLYRASPADWTDRYLLGNAALVFALFTLVVTKLPHYTLPAFPFLALLFGRSWMAAGLSARLPLRALIVVALLLAILALAAPALLSRGFNPSPVGDLVRQAGGDLKVGTRVVTVDFAEPNTVWELRRVTVLPVDEISPDAVTDFLNKPGSRAVLLTRQAWDTLGLDEAGLKICEAHGFSAAHPFDFHRWPRFVPLDLVLVITTQPSMLTAR